MLRYPKRDKWIVPFSCKRKTKSRYTLVIASPIDDIGDGARDGLNQIDLPILSIRTILPPIPTTIHNILITWVEVIIMQPLHTQVPLFFPKPELLLFIFWNRPASLVKLLLAASPLHHYLIIIQPHHYLAIATFDVARPRIVGILLKALRTIVALHDPKISYNLSVKHPCTLLP